MKILLNEGWHFKQVSKNDWMDACVPGCVHTDLLAHQKIEDPFYSDNEDRAQWIEVCDWEYQTSFEISTEMLEQDSLELVFEGLDTYATVFIDGHEVLQADNMYRRWSVSLKETVGVGSHIIRVVFESPVNKVLPILSTMNYRYHAVQDNAIEASALTRKAPYHYGWDWGPRLVTSGIFKEVSIIGGSILKLADVFIKQESISADCARLLVESEVTILDGELHELLVQLFDEEKQVVIGEETFKVKGSFVHSLSFSVDIKDPALWWPNGYGDQPLYKFSVKVSEQGSELASDNITMGLRALELRRVQDKWGESFEFVVNGQSVVAKGANWVPADSFVQNISQEKVFKLVEDAKAANFNMLRVWGGGVYETEAFYDACEANGIMVWQDFMFACSLMPSNTQFLANVREEAVQNIKRLRNYGCLVLWCGNNENEWIYDFENGGMQGRFGLDRAELDQYIEDYKLLYHDLLKEVCAAYDPTRTYWSSSPTSEGKALANDENYGDIHHWDVWHLGDPIDTYKALAPRFISEFGMQGMPAMPTVNQSIPVQQQFIGSPAMASHQKHKRGYELIRTYLEQKYPFPQGIEGFVYLSQVHQAEAIKMATEHFRNLFDKCKGILYWQFNDCWPVCSWSSIDYNGYWKALHFFAKKFFQPTLVYPYMEEAVLKVNLINELPGVDNGVLTWQLKSFEGQLVSEGELSLEISGAGSFEVQSFNLEDLGDFSKETTYFAVQWKSLRGTKAENIFYFSEVKHMDLPVPNIQQKWVTKDGDLYLVLKSPVLAKNVWLQAEALYHFEDNYFDIEPNKEYWVKCIVRTESDFPKAAIVITSLVDHVY